MTTRKARAASNGRAGPTPKAEIPALDWAALQYAGPTPGTPLIACAACGANYLDDEPSRAAHVAVFGHSPRRRGRTEEGKRS